MNRTTSTPCEAWPFLPGECQPFDDGDEQDWADRESVEAAEQTYQQYWADLPRP
jgi:hypothetical protein